MLPVIILALIQGLTEFLPVSSSGHLILIPYLIGWEDQGLEMDVALHAGTLLAVMFYFWHDVKSMIVSMVTWTLGGFAAKSRNESCLLALNLVIGTIPVVIIGFICKQLSTIRSPLIIASTGIFFGILLYGIDRWSRKSKKLNQLTPFQALFIGIAQAISLVPGVSRAGVTMTAALSLGFNRETAARFAFLLSTPAIMGAITLCLFDVFRTEIHVNWHMMAVGMSISMIAGLMAIHFMIKFLQHHSFLPFMIYRVLLGLLTMALV